MAKKFRATGSANKIKGRLVESIVAAMHITPGVRVEQNVRLPALTNVRRSREIDVLINGAVVGYPVRVAIECKNEKDVVGAPKIDAFVGKLMDVGIASQQGIYVSVKGFTRGALDRARQAGIRTLVLTGLDDSRLESVVHDVMQSVVHLYAVCTEWSIQNDIGQDIEKPEELALFLDEDGAQLACIADLAWRAWIEGQFPDRLGEHKIVLRVPLGWHQIVAGQRADPKEVTVTLQVHGIAVSVPGKAYQHELRNAESDVIEKLQLNASFETDPTRIGVVVFSSEDELTEHLKNSSSRMRLTTRIRLPRLQWYDMFWPPSQNFISQMNAALRMDAEGTLHEPDYSDGSSFERPSMNSMWNPIADSVYLRNAMAARFE